MMSEQLKGNRNSIAPGRPFEWNVERGASMVQMILHFFHLVKGRYMRRNRASTLSRGHGEILEVPENRVIGKSEPVKHGVKRKS